MSKLNGLFDDACFCVILANMPNVRELTMQTRRVYKRGLAKPPFTIWIGHSDFLRQNRVFFTSKTFIILLSIFSHNEDYSFANLC